MTVLAVTGLHAQVDTVYRDSTRAPQALPMVTIAGRRVSVPQRFEDAYKRAAKGGGVYFTREAIDATQPKDLETLFNQIPTVSMNDRGLTFQRCQAGLPSLVKAQPARIQVYIDGRRTSVSGDDGVRQLLKSISPNMVQLMEVYTGVGRIPAEFVNDACAVVVIWTRSY